MPADPPGESQVTPATDDIHDPAYVAALFDRCSGAYRNWSAVTSFGFVRRWRRQCVARLPATLPPKTVAVDLMAGTGEVWPHLLRRHPDLEQIIAIDISRQMHQQAMRRLHRGRVYADRITHLQGDALNSDLPDDCADILLSTFGLKTFSTAQQTQLAQQISRLLKPGGHVALIEASDPKGWTLRPLYRLYLDRVLPLVERIFLRGAQDFSMIGLYTRTFHDCTHMVQALRDAGLEASMQRHVFGCATSIAGRKPLK